MHTFLQRAITLAGLLAPLACGGEMVTSEPRADPLPTLRDVSSAEWEALARRRIFFGHQSVGGNIMAGVSELLQDHPAIRLNVVETRDVAGRVEPAFYHAPVGRNDYPLEKFDDFVAVASTAFRGDTSAVALVKLCYTDMHRDTDARALFAEYQRRVDNLRAANPSLTVVHVTTPLTNIENWKGRLMASVRGFSTQRERNAIRHRYNQLMRQAYQGKEPLLDVAALESTLPDGTPIGFRLDGEQIPLLAAQYTDDGGHLNAAARRRVAEQLLVTLAKLEAPRQRVATTRTR